MMVRMLMVALTTLAITLTSCSQPSADTESTALRLGMNVSSFTMMFPEAYQDAGNSDRHIRPDTVYGLPGRWVYHFSEGKLSWYVFTASQQDISRQSFDQYLRVANDLVATYDTEYGKATKVRRGIQDYQDPRVSSHSGYLVQQASWENAEGRRTVEFSFLGDHRNYSLLLTIQVGGR